jgi:AcrR family transcriptional regulator
MSAPARALPERVFKQRRAQQTYEALLAAAERVFAQRGFEGAQTPDIAAEAGVSTGALYRYFRDKQQLFVEMLDAYVRRESAYVHAQLSAERFVAAIDLVVDVLFSRMARNPALNRVYLAASFTDPEVAELRAAKEAEERASLAKLIEAVVPRTFVPSPEAAALIVQIAACEVAAERGGLRPRTGPKVPDSEVRAALGDLLFRYLHAPEAPPATKARRPKVK